MYFSEMYRITSANTARGNRIGSPIPYMSVMNTMFMIDAYLKCISYSGPHQVSRYS